MFSDTIVPGDLIRAKLSKWLDNPPEYEETKEAYKQLGILRAGIRIKKRAIEEIEEEISARSEHPRSNETRAKKVAETWVIKNDLAIMEAQEAELEMQVKFLEFAKQMFSAASFQSKQLYD